MLSRFRSDRGAASRVEIRHVDGAWRATVDGERVGRYGSGREAEVAGRRLAERLALDGRAVELDIRLRDGSFGASLYWPPYRAEPETVDLTPPLVAA